MAGLTSKTPSATYKDLLKIENSNSGVDDTLRQVESGDGTGSALYIEKNSIKITPATDDTALLDVKNKSGTTKFKVDSTNNAVSALGHNVNTQYAYFGIDAAYSAQYAANTHYPVPFGMTMSTTQSDVDFGTGTDPDDTFTTADTDTQYASQLIPMIWRIPDNITIDSVTHIEGADTATGDTTRMHLKSFTFTSGATSCLTAGTLLAHNSDTTNAGNEQPYLSTWTVDSADVDANKVLLCFFRSDSVNSDYSINVTVKYHLR
jgi:hypothetical protein